MGGEGEKEGVGGREKLEEGRGQRGEAKRGRYIVNKECSFPLPILIYTCTCMYTCSTFHIRATHLQIQQADFLHVFEGWNDPLLIAEVLHTALQPVQLLTFTLLRTERVNMSWLKS